MNASATQEFVPDNDPRVGTTRRVAREPADQRATGRTSRLEETRIVPRRAGPGVGPDLRSVRLDGCFAVEVHARHRRPGTIPLPVLLPSACFAGRFAAPRDEGAHEPLPAAGAMIDKYLIDAELGRGGFAVVYRATHQLMRTTVALKLLFPWTLRRHPQLAEQLCEEARFTSLVDHPNVVRVHDVTSGGEATFIVMEFIDGPTLGRVLARKPLDPANAIKLTMQVCTGLQAALAQGLVHRDIKPGNILVTRGGVAKIVDFGLARRAAAGALDDESARTRVARTAGTPAYIAPEQVHDFDGADHRADIYSLGATFYHAITGAPPFTGQDAMETIRDHLNRPPPHPASVRPGLPPRLCDLILAMLEKKPADRPQTYERLLADLRAILDDVRGAPALPAVTPARRPTPQPPTPGSGPIFGRLRTMLARPKPPL